MCGNVFLSDQIRAFNPKFYTSKFLGREEWELKNHAVGGHQARALLLS